MTASATSPRGLGVYLSSGDSAHEPAARLAHRLRVDLGARWALIWLTAPDGRTLDIGRCELLAEALADQGVEPGVWIFPAPDRAVASIDHLAAALDRIPWLRLVIADVERAPPALRRARAARRQPDPGEWTPERGAHLRRLLLDACRERHTPGVTSYGTWRGHQIPWEEIAVGQAQPQLYSTALDARAREGALARAHALHHGDVVPLVGLGGSELGRDPAVPAQTPEGLAAEIRAVALDADGHQRYRAVGLWSWALLRSRPSHVRACREAAMALGW